MTLRGAFGLGSLVRRSGAVFSGSSLEPGGFATLRQGGMGLRWWCSGYDSELPMQGAPALFLVRELDPTCRK